MGEHLAAVFLRRWRYWVLVAGLIVSFFVVGHFVEGTRLGLAVRYYMYMFLQNPWPRELKFRDVVVVRIDDDAFWKDARHRQPLDRSYLASLVQSLVDAEPAVIAVDVFMPSPDPSGKLVSTASDGRKVLEDDYYAEETADFLRAVNEAAKKRRIVLLESLEFAADNRQDESGRSIYSRMPDVFDQYPLENVTFAYSFFYDDRRMIPPRVLLDDNSEVDSLRWLLLGFIVPSN
ncbi:MAG: CHASE2 domain-containing protein [Pirellulales bacterium]